MGVRTRTIERPDGLSQTASLTFAGVRGFGCPGPAFGSGVAARAQRLQAWCPSAGTKGVDGMIQRDEAGVGIEQGAADRRTWRGPLTATLWSCLLLVSVVLSGCDLCSEAASSGSGYFKDRPVPVYEFLPPVTP
jgi:hypothetical protein